MVFCKLNFKYKVHNLKPTPPPYPRPFSHPLPNSFSNVIFICRTYLYTYIPTCCLLHPEATQDKDQLPPLLHILSLLFQLALLFLSVYRVRLQLVFGRSHFLLPSGVHLREILWPFSQNSLLVRENLQFCSFSQKFLREYLRVKSVVTLRQF